MGPAVPSIAVGKAEASAATERIKSARPKSARSTSSARGKTSSAPFGGGAKDRKSAKQPAGRSDETATVEKSVVNLPAAAALQKVALPFGGGSSSNEPATAGAAAPSAAERVAAQIAQEKADKLADLADRKATTSWQTLAGDGLAEMR